MKRSNFSVSLIASKVCNELKNEWIWVNKEIPMYSLYKAITDSLKLNVYRTNTVTKILEVEWNGAYWIATGVARFYSEDFQRSHSQQDVWRLVIDIMKVDPLTPERIYEKYPYVREWIVQRAK